MLQEADDGMNTGRHVMLQEKESVYDTVCRYWAATTMYVKRQSRKTPNMIRQFKKL